MRIESRGLCHSCYHDPKLRAFAPCKKKWVRWTAEDVSRLRSLRKLKLPLKDVAKLLGRTLREVHNKSRRMGFRRGKFGPPKGRSFLGDHTEIACFGCTVKMPKWGKKIFGWVTVDDEAFCPKCYVPDWNPPKLNHALSEGNASVGVGGPRIYKTPEHL